MEGSSRASRLFFASVSEVILRLPGLATIGRALAELPHLIRAEIEKLQVPFQRRAAGLRNFVRPIVHHTVSQSPLEEDISRAVVHPGLLPALQRSVVHVVALARVRIAVALPVFLNHTIAKNQLNPAFASRHSALRGFHPPFADPEIKLAVFRRIRARLQIVLGLFLQRREPRIAPQRLQMFVHIELFGAVVAIVHSDLQVFEGLLLFVLLRVHAGNYIFTKSWRHPGLQSVLHRQKGLIELSQLQLRIRQPKPQSRHLWMLIHKSFIQTRSLGPVLGVVSRESFRARVAVLPRGPGIRATGHYHHQRSTQKRFSGVHSGQPSADFRRYASPKTKSEETVMGSLASCSFDLLPGEPQAELHVPATAVEQLVVQEGARRRNENVAGIERVGVRILIESAVVRRQADAEVAVVERVISLSAELQ